MNLENFKPLGTISAAAMWAEIKEVSGVPFSLIFVRMNDKSRLKPKGQIIVMHQCLYGGAEREKTEKAVRADGEDRENAHYKHSGLMPIHNYETKQFHTILIASIIYFNGKKVNH